MKRFAEVDFLLLGADGVIPLEVKAGKAGALKSLHRFAHDKQRKVALRLDLNPPSRQTVDVNFRLGEGSASVSYELISMPLYMAEYVPAFAREI